MMTCIKARQGRSNTPLTGVPEEGNLRGGAKQILTAIIQKKFLLKLVIKRVLCI